MAAKSGGYLTPSGNFQPNKYTSQGLPAPGPYYQYYGEQSGYIYDPYLDRYRPDPKAAQDYYENAGLAEKEPSKPSTGAQLGTLAGGAALTAAGTYAGNQIVNGEMFGYGPKASVGTTPTGTTATPSSTSGSVGLINSGSANPAGTGSGTQTLNGYTLDGQLQVQGADGGLQTDQGLQTPVDGGTNYGAYAQGAAAAFQGYDAYKDYQNKDYAGASIKGGSAATNAAAAYYGADSTAAQVAPYASAAVGAYNAYKGYTNKDVDANTRATQGTHDAAVAIGSYFTGGWAGVADAAIRSFAPSFYDNHMKRMAKDPIVKQIGGLISGKDPYQFMRDQGRKYLKENKIIDENYIGTLADGTKYDFGKDGKAMKKIDYRDPITSEVIAKADLLAVGEGYTGKAREAMAMMYTNAALSNAEGDLEKAYQNIGHFMKQRGITRQSIDQAIEYQNGDGDEYSKERHDTYKATNASFTDKYAGQNVGLVNTQKSNEGSPGMRPGKVWNPSTKKYEDNKNSAANRILGQLNSGGSLRR
jgi:hypothetical protein